MLRCTDNPVLSPKGLIHVLGYTPTEGERGVPISVRTHFHPDLVEPIYVRLVVGNKPVATKVRELPGIIYGRWQLDAAAPPCDSHHTPSPKVLISIQALNDDNSVVDSVTFGDFSYWTSESSSIKPTDTPYHPQNEPHGPRSAGPSLRRRMTTHLPTSPPTFREHGPRSKARERRTLLHRRTRAQSLVRAQPPSGDHDDLYAQTPILDLVTPLGSLCQGWTQLERTAGRRLVRFAKVQEGRRLVVSCEPIGQEDYCESDSVISCIFREESKSCFVTSVDIIYLLERLTNDDFPVEEKNRIRRNLEGLRPTTISKHKSGFEEFFQRIMEFPDPKPRNIEKDLKVFEWTLLGQALEKILSKYSIYTSTVDPDHQEEDTLSGSPYPLASHSDHPPASSPIDIPMVVTKFEPLSDDVPFMSSSDESSDAYYSPMGVGSSLSLSPPLTYPIYASAPVPEYPPTHQGSDAGTGSWVSEYKEYKPVAADIGLDGFSALTTYDMAAAGMMGAGYADEGGYGYGTYEAMAYTAHGMHDDVLPSIPEHYL